MSGSKGGWKLSTIRLNILLDWSIIKLREIDGYSFAALFETASLLLLIKFTGVAKKNGPCILVCLMEFSSHVGCPPSGAKKW